MGCQHEHITSAHQHLLSQQQSCRAWQILFQPLFSCQVAASTAACLLPGPSLQQLTAGRQDALTSQHNSIT